MSVLSVVMLSVVMLNVVMLSVVMLNVVMLNVVAPQEELLKLLKGIRNIRQKALWLTRGQCYKTFYGRKLRLFIIS